MKDITPGGLQKATGNSDLEEVRQG